jgi:hypothetical protein
MPDASLHPQQLQAAEESAVRQSSTTTPDAICLPCQEHLQALEVCVVGEDDQGLLDVLVELRMNREQSMRARTGREGQARFDGLEPGARYQLSLPELDQTAWELLGEAPLPPEVLASRAPADWQTPPAPGTPPLATVHVVEQGDCFSSIAHQHGFLPETLWNLPENAALQSKRKQRHVLYPGDSVTLPPRQARDEQARSGQRYRVRRKGIPDMLRLRFLDVDEEPRVGLPFLLRLRTFDGGSVQDVQGELDAEGYVQAPIPPDADLGELILGTGPDRETYLLELGHLDPLDTFPGLQDRLANLGYFDCCEEDTAFHPVTRRALERLQLAHGLEPTGRPDRASLGLLEKLHQS